MVFEWHTASQESFSHAAVYDHSSDKDLINYFIYTRKIVSLPAAADSRETSRAI